MYITGFNSKPLQTYLYSQITFFQWIENYKYYQQTKKVFMQTFTYKWTENTNKWLKYSSPVHNYNNAIHWGPPQIIKTRINKHETLRHNNNNATHWGPPQIHGSAPRVGRLREARHTKCCCARGRRGSDPWGCWGQSLAAPCRQPGVVRFFLFFKNKILQLLIFLLQSSLILWLNQWTMWLVIVNEPYGQTW